MYLEGHNKNSNYKKDNAKAKEAKDSIYPAKLMKIQINFYLLEKLTSTISISNFESEIKRFQGVHSNK